MTRESIFEIFGFLGGITSALANVGPAIMGIIGVIAIFMKLHLDHKFRNRRVRKVEATILASELYSYFSYGNDRSYTKFCPKIKYSYLIDGKEIESTKVFYGCDSYSSSEENSMKFIVNKYPVNSTAVVYVNEFDHNDAYLEEAPSGMNALYIIGFVFIVIAVLFWGG